MDDPCRKSGEPFPRDWPRVSNMIFPLGYCFAVIDDLKDPYGCMGTKKKTKLSTHRRQLVNCCFDDLIDRDVHKSPAGATRVIFGPFTGRFSSG